MEVIILDSAFKHGISMEEIYEALANPLYEVKQFDTSRVPGRPDPDLYIGVTDTGKKLEILAFYVGNTVIFHCMPLRGKTYVKALELIRDRKES